VDVFTIVMAKSIEHVTKAWANPNNRLSSLEIAALLKEIEGLVDEVAQLSRAGPEPQ
jgi:hypothetical protein